MLIRERLIFHLVHHPSVVHHFQVVRNPEHSYVTPQQSLVSQSHREQHSSLTIQFRHLTEVAGPHQELPLLFGVRRSCELVFDLAPNLQGVNPRGIPGRTCNVETGAVLVELLEKHGGYLETTLLVHLRWTISPQFHEPRLAGRSVFPLAPLPSKLFYFALLTTTKLHFSPH